ncbi:MAG: SGNH/GDSL hydrolase family protein [Lachnospiraceae bacterium]|nr:SGNH/GDSL hydrolase family protein [Lachnospiraceae bacterium]
MNLRNKKINFLGDSITEGCGTSCQEAIFLNVLRENAGLAAARNYGIGGTRYAVQKGTELRPKDDYVDVNSFCERYDQMDDDADIVVVFGGTNDYGHGDAPLGSFSDRSPDTFYGACHYLYTNLIKKYLGKTIVIMTPLHRCNELSDRGDAKVESYGTLKVYVDIIREVAEYYSLPVLDLFANSGMQPAVEEIKNTYIPDGLHPNDLGHQVLAQKLESFLKTI